MNPFQNILRGFRSKLQAAIVCFVVVAACSFVTLRVAYRWASQRSGKAVANSAKQVATPSPADHQEKQLLQKLVFDDKRLDALEEQRANASRGLKYTVQGSRNSHVRYVATEKKVRRQLSLALQRLIRLEKHDADDDPQIIAVRGQITKLQTQMAQVVLQDELLSFAPPSPRNQAQLTQIDSDISACGKDVLADMQRIAAHKKGSGANLGATASAPDVTAGKTNEIRSSAAPRSSVVNAALLFVSMLLAFCCSIWAAAVFDRRDEAR